MEVSKASLEKAFEALVDNVKKSASAPEAMNYAQAALNLAHAACVFRDA